MEDAIRERMNDLRENTTTLARSMAYSLKKVQAGLEEDGTADGTTLAQLAVQLAGELTRLQELHRLLERAGK